MIVPIKAKQRELESKWVTEINNMQQDMLSMFKNNPQQAQRVLNNYSKMLLKKCGDAWDNLFIYLLVKYHDGNVKKEKDGKFEVTNGVIRTGVPEQPNYPERWYEIIVNDCGAILLNRVNSIKTTT